MSSPRVLECVAAFVNIHITVVKAQPCVHTDRLVKNGKMKAYSLPFGVTMARRLRRLQAQVLLETVA
jgi:hypothetical protein